MKKKSIFSGLICVLTLMIVSLTVFTGCGVEGSSSVQAIKFTQEVYYVDLNEQKYLDYKVYPNTASDYLATFSLVSSSYQDFIFDNGMVTVTGNSFNSITVDVRINDMTDRCEVRLRNYPRKIDILEKTRLITEGSIYHLEVAGEFLNRTQDSQTEIENRNCRNYEFNYKVTSSDPSVIEVIDESRLLVASTGRGGQSDISVEILNAKGEPLGLKTQMTIISESNVSSSFASVGNKVVKDNDTINITATSLEEFKVRARFFDEDEYLIETSGYKIYLSSADIFEISEDKTGLIALKSGKVKVTIESTATASNGLPYKIVFYIKLTVN